MFVLVIFIQIILLLIADTTDARRYGHGNRYGYGGYGRGTARYGYGGYYGVRYGSYGRNYGHYGRGATSTCGGCGGGPWQGYRSWTYSPSMNWRGYGGSMGSTWGDCHCASAGCLVTINCDG
ncbi:hypothetical protein niasHT_001503 [Heterodera trifolii]|uniref:Uncharacterized protein n=1 Tax=Heterodera trifolii TaxID=157864 RepID=A0ABD2MEM6_9BILA